MGVIPVSDPTESTITSQVLSKNAQKRLKKKEEREKTKEDWKKKQREKRKAAKQRRRENASETEQIPPKIKKPINSNVKSGKLIFDLAFDSLMKDTEVSSLCSQLSRCYAFNRRCDLPFELIITGFSGPVSEKIKKSHPEFDRWEIERKKDSLESCIGQEPSLDYIYLSADADEVLESVKEDSILIIGGIVDRNRHKGASLERAKSLGIRSCRLPLSEHVSLKSSQVLTVVHVVEILVKYRDTGSWKEAIEQVIPTRKRHA